MIYSMTKENYDEIIGEGKPVFIDFWAAWCGHCSRMSPIVEKLAENHSEVVVCKVNVDEQPELSEKFSVKALPTFVTLKDGKASAQYIGACGIDKLEQMLS